MAEQAIALVAVLLALYLVLGEVRRIVELRTRARRKNR